MATVESRGSSYLVKEGDFYQEDTFYFRPGNKLWGQRPYMSRGAYSLKHTQPNDEGFFLIEEDGWVHTGGNYPSVGKADYTPLQKGDLVKMVDFGSPYRFARLIIKRKNS